MSHVQSRIPPAPLPDVMPELLARNIRAKMSVGGYDPFSRSSILVLARALGAMAISDPDKVASPASSVENMVSIGVWTGVWVGRVLQEEDIRQCWMGEEQ